MNDNKATIWKWAVGLLVLCNLALIATIWIKPGQAPGPPHETPRDFVIRNVKFTDEQIKSYDALITLHRRAMDSLRKEAMVCRQLLFSNLKNEGKSAVNTDSLAAIIANTQKEIELVTYRHFAQVRTICTGQQVADFDKIIGDVIRKMNGRPGPPPGHGGPPPEGGPPPPDDREGPPHRGGPPPGDDGPPHDREDGPPR